MTARGRFPAWGLRGKTLILLALATCAVLALSIAVGHRALDTVRLELGAALARDHARLAQQRIEGKLGQELTLARLFAASPWLHEWMKNESDPAARARFEGHAQVFRQAFADGSYFVAVAPSLHFHYADAKAPEPRHVYTIDRGNPANAWYFATLDRPDGLLINVDFDAQVGVTNVWLNFVARQDGQVLGVVGTGLDLSRFIGLVLRDGEVGVTTLIANRAGTVVAHPDPERMQFDLAQHRDTSPVSAKTLWSMLGPGQEAEVRAAITRMRLNEGEVVTLQVLFEGRPHILALADLPSLDWTLVSAFDVSAGTLLTPAWQTGAALALLLVLALLFTAAALGVEGLVLRPLMALVERVRQVGAGDYAVRLGSTRQDELGDLTRAFADMTERVRDHATTLETQVAERTAALAAAHGQLAASHRQTTDSIRYASFVQHAILPERALREDFPGQAWAVWLPRDWVGGDLYLFLARPDGYLFGVVDCAGHGVAGACMTMVAHAAFQVVTATSAVDDPAAVLARMDRVVREMLPSDRRVVASLDVGLAYVDARRRQGLFAGARVDLFWSDGGQTLHLPGARQGLNDRRPGVYLNQAFELPPQRCFYLLTDGLLDQDGGPDGYALGTTRWRTWLGEQAAGTLAQQREALLALLHGWQGARAQRDDITVVAFQLPAPSPTLGPTAPDLPSHHTP